MKIDGIPGDSTDARHANELEVVSWSWGETSTYTAGGGTGGTTGRIDIQDLHFTAKTSKASPLLFINCATGTHSSSAELTARRPGSNPFEYLKITLTDVVINSYQVAGNENDDLPLDQVSLTFRKIQVSYIPQSSTGSAGTPITRGWDKGGNAQF